MRYVINEHYPYYAYAALEEEMSERSRSFRKMGRLVFRLANHWQPQYVVMGDYDFAPYAYAGCNSTLVRMIDDYYFDEEEEQRLLVVLDQDWLEDASIRNELLENSSDQMLLLILDIHANQHALHLWNEIISDTRCGVTYDLYSCGIVELGGRFKQYRLFSNLTQKEVAVKAGVSISSALRRCSISS